MLSFPNVADEIALVPEWRRFGRVAGVMGMLLEVSGLPERLAIGGHCTVLAQAGRRLTCEVVGFRVVILTVCSPTAGRPAPRCPRRPRSWRPAR